MNLSKLPQRAKVGVLGAGVSGLTFAYFLAKLRPDVNITLLESQPRVGGWINSSMNDKGVMLEKGPRTLRGVSEGSVIIVDMLKRFGLSGIINGVTADSEANKKYLLNKENKLLQVPHSASSAVKFFFDPLSRGFFSGLVSEPFRKQGPSHDITVAEFLKNRFGTDKIGDNILSAMFHGIYAGDIHQLSAKKTMAKMVEMEQEHGSIVKAAWNSRNKPAQKSELLATYAEHFGTSYEELEALTKHLKKYPMLALSGGLESLPRAFYDQVKKMPNVEIVTGANTETLKKTPDGKIECNGQLFDHVRSTLVPSKMSMVPLEQLKDVKYSTVFLVNCYLPKDILKHHGFGYLIPQSNTNHARILGVIFDSDIEKHVVPVFDGKPVERDTNYTKMTIMFGGHYFDHYQVPSLNVALKSIKEALTQHLELNDELYGDDVHWDHIIANDCLPQFHVGWNRWENDVRTEIANLYGNQVSLGGMAFSKGPGVPDVIANAATEAIALS